jgi:uncharacterized membrane protein YqgA involved in biofilm formation
MIGLGTVINVLAILVGSAIGVALGHRLPQRTRDVVTDGVGLAVLLVAALSAAAVLTPAVSEEVGASGVLIVLGSLLIGGILGSLWRIEARLEGLGESIRTRLSRRSPSGDVDAVGVGRADADGTHDFDADARHGHASHAPDVPDSDARHASTTDAPDPHARADPADPPHAADTVNVDVEIDGALADPDPAAGHAGSTTFVEGFVTASLVFCVGPLAILGSLSDGLGLGINQLALKSVMDGFTSIAFAATLGWGVAASALVVGVYQGTLTLLGWALGSVLSAAQIALLTATGGLLLVGIALRLLRIRPVPVGDLLPALLVAPILTGIVAALR